MEIPKTFNIKVIAHLHQILVTPTQTAVQTTNIDLANLIQNKNINAIAKIGNLAPAVSRWGFVVDNFLSQTGKETLKGKNYILQRNEDDDIANDLGGNVLSTYKGQVTHHPQKLKTKYSKFR